MHKWVIHGTRHILVAGGLQTFIAVLLFPTRASVSRRRRSSDDGDGAQAHQKMAWKAVFDGIKSAAPGEEESGNKNNPD